jgi:hypothetical protein
MRRLLAVASALALIGVTAVASAAPSPAKLALKPAQIGFGYKLQADANAHCLARCVTLDLCSATYLSEKLRTARYQVYYGHPGAAVQLSNEIVTYRAHAALLAKSEIARAAAACPATPVASPVRGVPPAVYRLERLHDSRLLPGALALLVHATYQQNGKTMHNTSVAVYQYQGDVFSGIYAWPAQGVRVADVIRVGLDAAAASAANLRRAAA